jgi:RecB family endonuclease NucS
VRLLIVRCEVEYTGRLTTRLPEAVRLIMIKADGGVSIWHDGGSSVKPQNWMTPPTVIEESDGLIVVRKHAGKTEDRLDIRIAEVVSDVTHDMGEAAALEKDGVERDLQEALADAPEFCGEGFRLVRREWPTDIGPVDLMCRDAEDGWIAVEIKRIGTIDAVEQLARYLERIRSTRRWASVAVSSPPSRSSRRRACSRSPAGSTASRSTSRCCAASASPT